MTIVRLAAAFAAVTALVAGPAHAQGSALAPGIAVATFDTAWSRINESHFDTAFLSTRWRVLRDSLRPLAERATTNNELRRIIQGMLSSIGTSHFGLIPREAAPVLDALDRSAAGVTGGGVGGPAPGSANITLRIANNALIVWKVGDGSPAWSSGVRPGDRVLSINGIALDSAVTQLPAIQDEHVRRQTSLTLAMRANAMLNGPMSDLVSLVIGQPGASRELRIQRAPASGAMVRFGNLPAMNAHVDVTEQLVDSPQGRRRIGVIAFSVWLPVVGPQIDSAVHRFRDADGIVLDLRGNPGGLAALTGRVAGHFVDSAYSLGTLYMRATTLNLVANPQRVAPDGETRVRPYDGPVAVLMDPLSASASEFFAAGIQGLGRARVFGDTSAGASVPALMGRLPNGDVMLHAIADHLDSRGRRVEGRGVIPDDIIPLNAADLAAGRDAPLAAALQWITTQPRRSQSQ
jgi:carboxyl-terminal processing protease